MQRKYKGRDLGENVLEFFCYLWFTECRLHIYRLQNIKEQTAHSYYVSNEFIRSFTRANIIWLF